MIAMSLLVAVAVAQILTALYLHTRPPHEELLPGQKAAIEERLFRRPKSGATPAAASVKVPAVAGVPPATVKQVPVPPTTVGGTLLQVAKGFRERGDTTNAIAKLQQATALDPGNAEILAELAMTYESMQLFDRSNEVWRRLQSLGPAVGRSFNWPSQLQVGVPPQGRAAANQVTSGIPGGSTFGISS